MEETQTTFYRVDGLDYVLDVSKFTAKIMKASDAKGDLVIPTKVNYKDKDYKVTVIGTGAFSGNENVKSLKFENDSALHAIEKNSFVGCKLTSVVFPASLTRIGDNAFSNCSELKSVEFANGSQLVALGKNVFPPDLLPNIKIPNDVKENTIATNLF